MSLENQPVWKCLIVAPVVRLFALAAEKVSAPLSLLVSANAEIAALLRQLTCALLLPIFVSNTPAMPLSEAHFGGFFVSGGRE